MASGQRGSVGGQQQQQQLVVHSSSAAGGTTTAAAVLFALHWRPAFRPAQYRAAASASAQPKGAAVWAVTPCISRIGASSRSNDSAARAEDK